MVSRFQSFIAACVTLLLVLPIGVSAQGDVRPLFSFQDPRGDDRGAGSLTYPTDETFSPHRELLDLRRFEIGVAPEQLVFSFTMGRIANPWNAPEGFYHPRIDLFIDALPGEGSTQLLRPGPGDDVRFDPDHAWDYWLRIAPWEGACLFHADDTPDSSGRCDGVRIGVEGATIVVRVPRSWLPEPSEAWRYYVLVGSFDALGVDGYRPIEEGESRWLLGSGGGDATRIVDLAAPRWGLRTQARQLTPDDALLLQPIGPGSDGWRWLLSGGLLMLLALLVARSKRFRIFRHRT